LRRRRETTLTIRQIAERLQPGELEESQQQALAAQKGGTCCKETKGYGLALFWTTPFLCDEVALWNWQWQLKDRLRKRTGRLFNGSHSMPMFGACPPYPSNSWAVPLAQNPEICNQLQSPPDCKPP
jgi:hypothetical protein